MILVGSDDGVTMIEDERPRWLAGSRVDALALDGEELWAVADGATMWRGALDQPPTPVAALESGLLRCVLRLPEGTLAGASEARLYRLEGDRLEAVPGFDEAPGRETWHTPWGGPPDVRSLAADTAGDLYANVHVGGVLRSGDGGATWSDTMDISADVHEVIAHPTEPGVCFAAAAIGLGISTNGAETWDWITAGLHATYCRAVAVAGDQLLVSASQGPGGVRSAVYRAPVSSPTELARCADGLPEWFPGNVDTFCLAGSREVAVIGSPDGSVFTSTDGSESWEEAATGMSGITCVVVAET